MRGWLLSILAAALLLSVLQAAMPKGTVRQVGGLAAGLVLILVILRPVFELTPDWLTASVEAQYQSASAYADDLEVTNESYLESIMSQRSAEYIVSQAAALGYTVEAQVDCTWSDGYPVPACATVRGTIDPSARTQLDACIRTDLGIPSEQITYEEVAS